MRAPPSAETVPTPPNSELAFHYQRLVLLNRVSIALFGDKPFALALPEACHAAMALMGAQSIAVYFADGLDQPLPAHRLADEKLSDEGARAQENALISEAFTAKTIVTRTSGGRSWRAAPLLRLTREAALVTGGVVFGYTKETPLDSESEGSLVEIARHLRNARLIQQTLQHQKVSAAIVEQSTDAIFVTDLEEKVLAWNRGASELSWWRADEVIGRHGEFLVPPERRAEVAQLIADIHRGTHKASVETVCLRKDGAQIPVEGSFTLLRDDDNTPFAVVRAYRDITKRKEAERLKNEVVSLVSHELRTPLTAIQGFAEMIFELWDELTPDKRRHYLQVILDESKRLALMVADFLNIAQIESGDIAMHIAEVRIATLFERIARLFEKHPINPRFAVDIKPGAETILGDEEQLYRLLLNLVGNALKYTPPGGTVALAAATEGDGIELSVSDQGPGIAKEDQTRLFQKFYRVDDAITRKTPGTGLGLAICKGIVEAHSGRIWVDSRPGRGARFIARLPKSGPKKKALR